MLISVVIPCFKVKPQILEVLAGIGPEVHQIIVVDDACPEASGAWVSQRSRDPRVTVLTNKENLGVGGAVIRGYEFALQSKADVVVKLDGDGQMDPSLIQALVHPILIGEADYTKGNRFDSVDDLSQMPKIRIFGNAVLSLMTKVSSGYWTITDPTNGFTAIHRTVLSKIHLEKIRKSYFFESDMLFRLNLSRAVVEDVPMKAIYGEEKSNLRISRVLLEFPIRHFVNHTKRVFYRYFLREWSIASFELPLGLGLMTFGAWFGLTRYLEASEAGQAATAGQVTIASLSIILGVQLLLSFLAYDIQSEPRIPRQRRSK